MDKRNGLGYVFRIAVGITILLLLLAGSTNAAIITVPDNSTKIQWAIDNATSGDTIVVHNGIYYENVNVTKQLTVRSIGMPVVDANGSGNAITLAADGIILEGFTVTGAGFYPGAGIKVTSNNNTLSSNNASNNSVGIFMPYSSNNTLSGNNVSKNNDGIILGNLDFSYYSNNNTLSGNNVSNNVYSGISLYYSNNNMLNGNNALNNSDYGIYLSYSSKNVLINNIMKWNKFNFELGGNSDSDFDNQIDTTNLVDGKPVYYIKGASNRVYDSSTSIGTFYCISCVNVTLKNLDLKSNGNGIFFWNTISSKIQNVNTSNSIYLSHSSNNTLSGNNASNNGIHLLSSSNNTLSGNNVNSNNIIILEFSSDNTLSGNNASISLSSSNNNTLSGNNASISLSYSSNNTLNGNDALNNSDYGILMWHSSNNLIYNNIFRNSNNVQVDGSINNWNITKQSGTNILGGSYLGGNFWANTEGTGFSQTCSDVNRDGICDENYVLDANNIDYLPLSGKPSISFTDPTPADGATPSQNYAYINTTISDSSTAFIDWNRSLIGWWRFNNESGETSTFFRTGAAGEITRHVQEQIALLQHLESLEIP